MLQVLFCTDMPSQKAPPLSGAGLVQVRERFCTPRPQRTLQGDQSVHDDQPPFTEGGGEEGETYISLRHNRGVFEETITDVLLMSPSLSL